MPDVTTPILGFTEPTVGADNGTWGGVLNTDIGNLDTYLGVLRQAAKAATIGVTTTLDFNAPASVFTLTVTQATTIAIANAPANITTQQLATHLTLILTNGNAFAVTWPASFTWVGGTAPTLQTAGTDIITAWSPDNGVTWYAAQLWTKGSGSRVVGQAANTTPVSLTSGVETNLGVLTIPAASLTANGQQVRIRVTLTEPGAAAGTNVRIKFGSTYVVGSAGTGLLLAQNQQGEFDVIVARTGASAELADALESQAGTSAGPNTATVSLEQTAPAENTANLITVAIRAKCNNSGFSMGIRQALIEVISP